MSNPVAFITFRPDFTAIEREADRSAAKAGARYAAKFISTLSNAIGRAGTFDRLGREADRSGADAGRRLGRALGASVGRPLDGVAANLRTQTAAAATGAGRDGGRALGLAITGGINQINIKQQMLVVLMPGATAAGRDAGGSAGRAIGPGMADAMRSSNLQSLIGMPIKDVAAPAGKEAGTVAGKAVAQETGNGVRQGGLGARLKDILSENGKEAGRHAGTAAGKALDGALSSILGGAKIPTSAAELGKAIGNQLKAGFTRALDVQAGTNLIQAQLGLSDADAAMAGSAAGDVFRNNFGAALGDAQAATGAVMGTFRDEVGSSERTLEGLTEGALTFAKISGDQVPAAVGAAGLAMQRGLARDGTHAFDLLVTASQAVPAHMRTQLTGAVTTYSDELANMGFTGEQAFGLLVGQFEGGQEQVAMFGQSLSTLSGNLTSGLTDGTLGRIGLDAEAIGVGFAAGGEQAAGAFDQIVDGVLAIEDPVKRSTAAVELFGEPLGALGPDQLTSFLKSMDITKVSLDDVGGAAAEAGDNIDKGLRARLEELKRRGMMAVADFFGDTLVPGLTEGARQIQEAFNTGEGSGILGWLGTTGREVYDWFKGTVVPGLQSALGSFQEGLAGTAGEGSFFADLAEGLMTAGRMIEEQLFPVVQDVFDFFSKKGKPILIGIGVALGLWLAPITTIAGGFIYLYQRFEWFRDGVAAVFKAIKYYYETIGFPFVKMFWNVVKTFLGLAVDYFRTVLLPVIGKVISGIRWYFTNVWLPAFKMAWSAVSTFLGRAKDFIVDTVIPVLGRIWTTARTVFTGVWAAIQGAWKAIWPVFQAIGSFITGTLVPILQRIWSTAVSVFQGVWAAIQTAWAAITPIFTGIITFITGTLVPIFQRIWSTAVSVFQGVWAAIQTAWAVISPIFTGIVTFITGTLIPIFQNIWTTVSLVFLAVFQTIQAVWGLISPIFGAIVGFIRDHIIGQFNRLWSVASLVFNGVWGIIQSAWGFIQPIFAAIVGFIRDQVEWRFNLLQTAVSTVWSGIERIIDEAWGFIQPKFQAIVDFVNEHLIPIWDDISSAVGDAFDAIPGAIRTALSAAGRVVGGFLDTAATVARNIQLPEVATTLERAADSARDWGSYAQGGRITGGVPGKDSVPIMAMPGEYVQRRSAVQQWGVGAMEALNRGHAPSGWKIPGYAAGGSIPGYLPGGSVVGGLVDAATGAGGAILDAGRSMVDKLRDVIAGGLEKLWPKLDARGGLLGVIPGGHNYMREHVIRFVKGEADRELAEEAAKTPTGSATGLDPVFLQRFNAYSAAVGGLRIVSGFRSYAQQAALYQAFLNGTGNLAAEPGHSNHERGLAIDHAPRSTFAMRDIARGFRLHYPVRGEPWHVEPFAKGGMVRPVSVHRRSFDSGGVLRPGWNVVDNKTGGPEPLVPARSGPLLHVERMEVRDDIDVDLLVQKLATRTRLATP